MSKRHKRALPFDKRGGIVALRRQMIESDAYHGLSLYARNLMLYLQLHWTNDRPVAYGIREASTKLRCNQRTAMKTFNELEAAGFILLDTPGQFNSRTGSRARTWVLTWLPYRDRPPTNNWEGI